MWLVSGVNFKKLTLEFTLKIRRLAQLVEQRTFIVGLAPDILEVTHATQVTVAAEMADSKILVVSK